jgi:shikimate dehydrogenase
MPEPWVLRLGLIGDPVEHSKSPALLRALLASGGLAGSYDAMRVAAGDGARAIDELRAGGYHGLNVTTPLKEEAFAHAAWRDATALAGRSANTLVLTETIEGHNTDGIGAIGALRDAGLTDFAGARILVLGAGPTARAVSAALAAADAVVSIWNRTLEHAQSVALALDARVFAASERFDAVFAALPPAVIPDDPALVRAILDAPLFIDANYGDRATLAASLGRSGIDGESMLAHSARASFDIWLTALGAGAFPWWPSGGTPPRF